MGEIPIVGEPAEDGPEDQRREMTLQAVVTVFHDVAVELMESQSVHPLLVAGAMDLVKACIHQVVMDGSQGRASGHGVQ